MKTRFRLNWQHDDDEEEWIDDDDLEEGECHGTEVEGPSYAPVFTGILKADGTPLIRHPVVMRMGFHLEENKLYCPTLEEGKFGETEGRVFGWVYD